MRVHAGPEQISKHRGATLKIEKAWVCSPPHKNHASVQMALKRMLSGLIFVMLCVSVRTE
ncbi:MAG: hypothetical protein CFE39_02640 [Comamonadaceae bacterium PBBC2]|nr:MAG: hypothetical protein CFE39_02640 [Comamonadaceae bacterium PBBC2]